MDKSQNSSPFSTLGSKLRWQRERLRESIAEVAGAVEIGEEDLLKIEQGSQRPSEDLLMLLFNHFNTAEDEAVSLWELAGYAKDDLEDNDSESDDLPDQSQHIHKIMMTVAMDPRVIYSDSTQVIGNKHGLVLNFMQPAIGNLQPVTVARVGMSRAQAEALQLLLKETLDQLKRDDEPKHLPPQASN